MSKTVDWKTEIDLVTEKFRSNFSNFTQEEMNYKLKENDWSIAQIITHIILLNNSYFEYFKEIQNGNHTLQTHKNLDAKAESSLTMLMPFTKKDRLKRTNTWDIWEPPSVFIDRNVIQDFEESQFEFKKLIENFEASIMSDTFIKYPGHLDLVFKLDDCISFLIEHENRHLNQAFEIGRHSQNS
ncbi:MAG TPA: DinB family protein [Flavobacteriaceae bacterium]